MIFTTPRKDYYKGLLGFRILNSLCSKWGDKYSQFDIEKSFHCSLYEEEDLKQQLLRAGFTEVEIYPFYSKNILSLYDMLNLSAKLPAKMHFWGELQVLCFKKTFFKATMKSVVKQLVYSLVRELSGQSKLNNAYTHNLYICKKGAWQ